ncbi:MAG: GntR family transcriptional regulator [Pseudomonadota bacterium]
MNKHQAPEPKGTELSATRQAYMGLRGLILTGELAPGEKLKIDGLKDRLGLGASPIREALSELAAEQLVDRHDQRGFRTAPASRANFEEILELRCMLESRALRKSVANMDEAGHEALLLSHHRMTRARGQDREVFEDKHKAFHMAIIGRCDAPVLLQLCSQLYDLNIRYRYIAGALEGYQGRDPATEHQDILNAILDGDVDRADDLLMRHYQTTGAFLSARLD